MKKILFVLSFLSLVSFANAGVPEIFEAIGSGDITTLSSYFDENVEVYMEGNQEVLSKTEATEMIKNFLNRNKPKSFGELHKNR